MTRIILFIFFFKAFIVNDAAAQKPFFEIKIFQDSIHTPNTENEVLLQKKPFKILVQLQDMEGVYMYAAFNDSIYKIDAQQEIPGFKDVPSMSMAEESFNPDQEMIISDDGWAYWFYDKKQDWHRFDKDIIIKGKKISGTKSVKQFYFTLDEKKIMVEDVSMPLYLFFFSATENKGSELEKEWQRYKVKITWQ
jgi:hypothetical protein